MKHHAVVLFALVALFGAACSAAVDGGTTSVVADTESTSVDAQTQPESATESAVEPDATEPEAAAAPEATEEPEVAAATPGEAVSDENQEPVAAAETSSAPSPSLGSSDWCSAVAQIESTVDPDDLSDPAALKESYTAATQLMAEAVRIAPPELAPDVAAMAQGTAAITSLLEEAEWNFLNVDLAAMEEIAVGLDIPGDNFERYNFEVCGIGEDPNG